MKKRIVAIFLVLALAVCALPASAFADNETVSPASTTVADTIYFRDANHKLYPVKTATIVSTTTNSTYTGYVIVIQEVLQRLYMSTGNANYNPQGVDGVFGNNTRLAVVSFQVAYLGANEGAGVVGPKTWGKLHDAWVSLGSPDLTYLHQ